VKLIGQSTEILTLMLKFAATQLLQSWFQQTAEQLSMKTALFFDNYFQVIISMFDWMS
jgi:hypothetical protein